MTTKIGNAEVRTPQFGLVQLLWQGVGDGAAALSAQTPADACGFTVLRTGVGAFTITLSEKWAGGCLFIKGMVYNDGTPLGGTVEMVAKYDPAAMDIDIEFMDGAGAPQDIPTGAELWLELSMSNRTVAPPLTPA